MTKQEQAQLITALNKYGHILMIDKESQELFSVTNTFKPTEFFNFIYLSEYLGIEEFENSRIDWDRLFERLSGRKFVTELWVRGEAYMKLAERGKSLYVIMVDNPKFIDVIENIVVGRIVRDSVCDLVG